MNPQPLDTMRFYLKILHEMHLACKSSYHYGSVGLSPKSTMKWFCPYQFKLPLSSILAIQDEAPIIFNISSYHEYFNSSLLQIYYPKLSLRPTISRYHEIFHIKLSWDSHLKLSCLGLVSPGLLHNKWPYNLSSS